MSIRISLRDFCLVLLVYIAAFLLLVGFPHLRSAFPLDDSWIHQDVARNLAHDGTLGFIPGVQSSGSSSLLWSFVLAAKWKFLPGLDPVWYTYGVSLVLFAAIGCGLLAMARRDELPEAACWVWALAPALDGNFVWLGAVGMEHLLFVALSVLGIFLWFQQGMRSAILCALCLGALSITRPEGVFLTVLVLLTLFWFSRSRKEVAVLLAVVGVFVLLGLMANYITSHSWLPTTYAGRKWLYFGTDQIKLRTRIRFLQSLWKNILHPWDLDPQSAQYVLAPLVFVLGAIGLWSLLAGKRVRCLLLCVWSFGLVAIYTAMLPHRGSGGRYQPLFLALTFPLMMLGVQYLLSVASRRLSPSASEYVFQNAVVVVLCLACGVFSLKVWREATQDGMTVIESTHAKMGRYLVDNLPPNSKVAAFDIGRIQYLYDRRLDDLGGLTDTSFLPYMRQHRMLNYLADKQIPYFVWPSLTNGDSPLWAFLRMTPEVRSGLTPVVTYCAPPAEWLLSDHAATPAAPCQTLYRLNGVGVGGAVGR